MSIISNSFKKTAALKLVKSFNIEDSEVQDKIIEAWTRGFDLAEQMFTEQN